MLKVKREFIMSLNLSGVRDMSKVMDKPNILIIMTEHQQGRTVDPDSPCRMPNIKDRLAGEGMRFELGYTPTALCAPARASFFTGLYPTVHGMYNNYHSLPVLHPDLFHGVGLFSEYLKEASYNLSYIRKWHVSGVRGPTNYGWHIPEGSNPGPRGYPEPERRKSLWRKQISWEPPNNLRRYAIIKGEGDLITFFMVHGRESLRIWRILRGEISRLRRLKGFQRNLILR